LKKSTFFPRDLGYGVTVSVAVGFALPADAVIVTLVCAATAEWPTAKVVVVCPAANVTVAGTVAAGESELARATTIPPLGAGPDNVTVPVTTVVELP
jgi:hypothetical protein